MNDALLSDVTEIIPKVYYPMSHTSVIQFIQNLLILDLLFIELLFIDFPVFSETIRYYCVEIPNNHFVEILRNNMHVF